MTAEPTAPISRDWQIEHYAQLESTNSHLLNLAAQGHAQPGVVIIADQQSGGRGRQGRTWEAPKGGLYLSALIEDHEGWGARWALITGLAVHQAIATQAPALAARVKLKWPNDLLVDDQKLCGILIERAGEGAPWRLVIGIGVNIEKPEAPRENTAYPSDLIPGITAEGFAPILLDTISRLRRQFAGKPADMIRRAWLEHAWRLGGAVSCHVNGERVHGVFRDLDADGSLILARDDGREQRITGGEVHFGEGG